MKIIECEQRSPEWFAARLGIPTASAFKSIITPGGERSKSADGYANELLAEILAGEQLESFESPWMTRGREFEEEAAQAYGMITERKLLKVGFVTNDDGTMGCSPDRLVDDDGLLEVKVPSPANHVHYLLTRKLDRDYFPQLQGQLYVTGRQWVDWMSYHSKLPPCIIRVYRNDEYIAALDQFMGYFLEGLKVKCERMRELRHLT